MSISREPLPLLCMFLDLSNNTNLRHNQSEAAIHSFSLNLSQSINTNTLSLEYQVRNSLSTPIIVGLEGSEGSTTNQQSLIKTKQMGSFTAINSVRQSSANGPQPRDPPNGRSPSRPRPPKPIQPRDDGSHRYISSCSGPQPRDDGSRRQFSGKPPNRPEKPPQPRDPGSKKRLRADPQPRDGGM